GEPRGTGTAAFVASFNRAVNAFRPELRQVFLGTASSRASAGRPHNGLLVAVVPRARAQARMSQVLRGRGNGRDLAANVGVENSPRLRAAGGRQLNPHHHGNGRSEDR